MQNTSIKKIRPNFYKTFKRKIFLSHELKKCLFRSFLQAKNRKTYIDLNGLLYGLLSQPNSLSTRLFLNIVMLSKKRNEVNLSKFNERILDSSYQRMVQTISNSTDNSIQTFTKDQQLPYFTPQVKEILKNSIRASLKSKKKICIVTTKDVFFELISRETIRDLLYQITN